MKRALTRNIGIVGLLALTSCGHEGPEQTPGQQTLGHESEALTAPTQVNAFALLATGHVSLGDRTVFSGGHLGVSPGSGDSVTEGSQASIALGKSTLGQRVVLKDHAQAGDLFTNSIGVGSGATYTSLSPYTAPPAEPPIVAFTAGSTPLSVTTPMTVAAGNFGQVTVNSTLTLSGGTYQFQNLTFGTNAVLQASAAAIVRVSGKVSGATANFVRIGPTGTQPAGNLRLIVAGATDTNGGVTLGTDAKVTALVVSLASFSAADRFVGKGAVAAKNVTLGNDSSLTFQTGFECNADAACDDGNPCTTDSCVDAKCVHPAVPNGTLCPDDGNVCTSDACSNGVCAHPAVANGTACTSDNNECTGDVCASGACTHPAVANGTACTNEGNPCTNDVCQAGACAHPAVADGTACPSDGQECTNDVCSAGVCAHPAVADGTPCLDDLQTCTADECSSGLCAHPAVADGTPCDNDGNDCTDDVCAGGGCTHPLDAGVGSCQAADGVTPIFECVTALGGGRTRALFGFENDTGAPIHAAQGTGNDFSPSPGVRGQPTNFAAGHFDDVFAVDFNGPSVTWQLGTHSAVAAANGPACPTTACSPACSNGEVCVAGACVDACGDSVCAGEDCKTCPFDCGCTDHPPAVLVDRPGQVNADALSNLVPDVPSSLSLDGLVFGGYDTQTFAPAALKPNALGAAPAAAPAVPTVPFTFHVTSLDYKESEFLCGTVDPYVKDLVINGVDLGKQDHGTVEVPLDQKTVPVHFTIFDSDGGLCFGDEHLDTWDIDVSNVRDESACPPHDNGSICWDSTASGSPDVCFDWNGQFIDAGPWGNGIPSEDFYASKGVQQFPASFARMDATIKHPDGTGGEAIVYQFGGFLDQRGCIPPARAPLHDVWKSDGGLLGTFRLSSQLCLDPNGFDCLPDQTTSPPTLTGANVAVVPANATGAETVCAVITDDTSLATDPNCNFNPVTWVDLPPDTIRLVSPIDDPATRVAAVVGHIFNREVETDGGLGVENAMIDRRIEGNGLVTIDVDTFCCLDDQGGGLPCSDPRVTHKTSCRAGSVLELEPDTDHLSGTHFKYVIAHEFGHFIQGNAQGLMDPDYGGVRLAGEPTLCGCDLVAADDNLHCLQSVELPNAAQDEGFGQYFASMVWNDDEQSDCTFVYYKNFADTTCRPGVSGCTTDTASGLTVNPPPIPVNCAQQVRWRNDNCLGPMPSTGLLTDGTEYDWLEFLYGIGQNSTPALRWNMQEIFDAYVLACGGAIDADHAAPCSHLDVSWAGDTTGKTPVFSLRDGAQTLVSSGEVSQAAADRFRQLGDDFGISNTPPAP
ncbi:MAG TPA: hypothetical protein VMI54_16200 [Polyangiaceae bacterium]|nr:hypothetical protein [Polyangiaceae bacterium]